MGNLSGVTFDGETFAVLAGGGGSGVIEGEYTIPEVYWCSNDGTKPSSGNTVAGQNAKVWYQKTGKHVRAVITFTVYSARDYGADSFGFNRSDLFGDGKLFDENSSVAFFQLFGYGDALPQFANSRVCTPPYLLLKERTGTTGNKADFYLDGTNSISNFPSKAVGTKNTILIDAVCL